MSLKRSQDHAVGPPRRVVPSKGGADERTRNEGSAQARREREMTGSTKTIRRALLVMAVALSLVAALGDRRPLPMRAPMSTTRTSARSNEQPGVQAPNSANPEQGRVRAFAMVSNTGYWRATLDRSTTQRDLLPLQHDVQLGERQGGLQPALLPADYPRLVQTLLRVLVALILRDARALVRLANLRTAHLHLISDRRTRSGFTDRFGLLCCPPYIDAPLLSPS